MDFATFVKSTDQSTVYSDVSQDERGASQRSALQRLGRALDRSKSVEILLDNNDEALDPFPPATLARLADAFRAYTQWKDAAKTLRRFLAKNNLSLPDGSVGTVFTAHEIRALERTAELCPRSVHPDHDTWALAVKAHVDFWKACVSLSLAHGSAVVDLAGPEHPDAGEFENQLTKRAILSEIRGYNWLAIRRGERAKILRVTLELPILEIQRQVEARMADLGLVAKERGPESMVKDLVMCDLEPTVRQLLDQQAENEALDSSRTAYMSLLETPPLQVNLTLAVYVGNIDAPAGVVLLDKKADIIDQAVVSADGNIGETVQKFTESYAPDVAVLPITSRDPERLSIAERSLGNLPIHRVSNAAISQALENLPMERSVAGAVVFGRRALKPGREWSRVDPVSLGLGEYPREIDPETLERILNEARLLSSWKRRRKNSSRQRQGGGRSTRAGMPSGRRLNPLVKTIRDLKPGMTVDGVITNITRFGAFVNLGLPTEGMIHVSQLSVEFVENPGEVVRVGQQVKARVLEVIPEKDRIALSLKPTSESRKPDTRSPSADLTGAKPNRAPPKSRSEALADLDKLFKK